ncbi:small EDRK-rich factor 2, partial [Guaruba guarouba]
AEHRCGERPPRPRSAPLRPLPPPLCSRGHAPSLPPRRGVSPKHRPPARGRGSGACAPAPGFFTPDGRTAAVARGQSGGARLEPHANRAEAGAGSARLLAVPRLKDRSGVGRGGVGAGRGGGAAAGGGGAMTRGNQRELARQKNLKKQSDSGKGKRRDDGLSAAARKQRDSEIMQQKQKKADEKKEGAK